MIHCAECRPSEHAHIGVTCCACFVRKTTIVGGTLQVGADQELPGIARPVPTLAIRMRGNSPRGERAPVWSASGSSKLRTVGGA